MKQQIMKLIVECGCAVIVLDPLQDILDGLSNEDQAVFLRWMKGVIKSHGVTFVTVNHVRKNGTEQKANSAGAELHEEDMAGSSTIFKSGACNLLFSRNKEAEDPIERNTTHMKCSKLRWTWDRGMLVSITTTYRRTRCGTSRIGWIGRVALGFEQHP